MIPKIRASLFICFILLASACNNNDPAGGNDTEDSTKANQDETAYQSLEIKELSELIKKEPLNSELYYQRADKYIEKNNIQAAVDDLNKAIDLNSKEGKYYFILAGIYYLSQDYIESFRLYLRSYEYQPEHIPTNLQLAWLNIIMEKYQKSFFYSNNALKQDVHNAIAYFYKGLAYKELGDTAKSISSFQTAIEQSPDYYEPYIQVGLIMTVTKNPLGLSYFQNAIRLDSVSAEAWYGLGMFYQSLNEFNNAIKTYRSLINLQPQFHQAYYNIGYIYYNQSVFDTAYRHFDMAIKVSPSYANAYYMRGQCSEQLGDKSAALSDYRQALVFNEKLEEASNGVKRLGN